MTLWKVLIALILTTLCESKLVEICVEVYEVVCWVNGGRFKMFCPKVFKINRKNHKFTVKTLLNAPYFLVNSKKPKLPLYYIQVKL